LKPPLGAALPFNAPVHCILVQELLLQAGGRRKVFRRVDLTFVPLLRCRLVPRLEAAIGEDVRAGIARAVSLRSFEASKIVFRADRLHGGHVDASLGPPSQVGVRHAVSQDVRVQVFGRARTAILCRNVQIHRVCVQELGNGIFVADLSGVAYLVQMPGGAGKLEKVV
jgi:hypothetical protein